MATIRNKTYGEIIRVTSLSDLDIEQMFVLFEQFYHGVKRDIFASDLAKKNHIILVRAVGSKKIVGFSTIALFYFKDVDGKQSCGVFSGDTILEPAYWGCRTLQYKFVEYVLTRKLSNPRERLYWLLISKGYKTYLLMANNFSNYYPHPSRNQHLKTVVRDYCERMFPGCYNEETGLLNFGDDYQKLKTGIADITAEMRVNNSKIDFFEARNPTWRDGTELPGIAIIDTNTFRDYFGYRIPLKIINKLKKTAR